MLSNILLFLSWIYYETYCRKPAFPLGKIWRATCDAQHVLQRSTTARDNAQHDTVEDS
jgi:hypothetical protein